MLMFKMKVNVSRSGILSPDNGLWFKNAQLQPKHSFKNIDRVTTFFFEMTSFWFKQMSQAGVKMKLRPQKGFCLSVMTVLISIS